MEQQISPYGFVEIHKNEFESATIFYPGAGSDSDPLMLFASQCHIKTIIHVDYSFDRNSAIKTSSILGNMLSIHELDPHNFGKSTWLDFWHSNPASKAYGKTDRAYATKVKISHDGHTFDFQFFGTEALQTFEVLFLSDDAPTVIVLQDHGLGGLWTRFGEDGKLFYELVSRMSKLPKYLYVAENTDAWEGYIRVTSYVAYPGQMHSHRRAIFKRVTD